MPSPNDGIPLPKKILEAGAGNFNDLTSSDGGDSAQLFLPTYGVEQVCNYVGPYDRPTNTANIPALYIPLPPPLDEPFTYPPGYSNSHNAFINDGSAFTSTATQTTPGPIINPCLAAAFIGSTGIITQVQFDVEVSSGGGLTLDNGSYDFYIYFTDTTFLVNVLTFRIGYRAPTTLPTPSQYILDISSVCSFISAPGNPASQVTLAQTVFNSPSITPYSIIVNQSNGVYILDVLGHQIGFNNITAMPSNLAFGIVMNPFTPAMGAASLAYKLTNVLII